MGKISYYGVQHNSTPHIFFNNCDLMMNKLFFIIANTINLTIYNVILYGKQKKESQNKKCENNIDIVVLKIDPSKWLFSPFYPQTQQYIQTKTEVLPIGRRNL